MCALYVMLNRNEITSVIRDNLSCLGRMGSVETALIESFIGRTTKILEIASIEMLQIAMFTVLGCVSHRSWNQWHKMVSMINLVHDAFEKCGPGQNYWH